MGTTKRYHVALRPLLTEEDLDRIDRIIGERIRSLRQLARVSQETLANACGVSFQQIQKYEKGKNRVSGSRLVQIARLLQVQPSYFVDGILK